MNIPNYIAQQLTKENGYPTDTTQNFLDILTQQLQKNVGDEGYVIPSLSLSNIQNIVNNSNVNAKPNGTIFYCSDLNKFLALQNNVLVYFNTTPV